MTRTLSLILASISFIIVIGGAVYEHLAVVPVWSAAAPASLTMFQGEYALAPQNFWPVVHPVAIVLLVASLFLNWTTERRHYIASVLAGYVHILGITAVYFVPELMSITKAPYSATVDPGLTRRAGLWESLSIVRLVFLLGLAMMLLLGLSKNKKEPN